MSIRAASLSVFALLATAVAANGGAWTLPQDKGQVVITGTMSRATQTFDGDRDLTSTATTRKDELQALFEYGVTDRFTLMLGPGLQHIDIGQPVNASRSGFGYQDVGGRYLFYRQNDWVFSGQALVRVPGTGQDSNPAAIGYTEPEYELRGLVGKTLTVANHPAFIDLQVAQRYRAGAAPNEFRIDVTFGIRPAPRWLLLAQSLNVISEGSGSPPFTSYDYSKLQFSVVYDLSAAWSVQAGGFTTVSGRNALQENGVLFGLWYRF